MTEKNESARALSARLCEIVDNMTVSPERRLAGNARRLDAEIATLVWGPPEPSGLPEGPRRLLWWHGGVGHEVAPEFTTLLDAGLPGEVVRFVLLMGDGRWEAEAMDARGDYHRSEAATEALARRAAALLAWGATR